MFLSSEKKYLNNACRDRAKQDNGEDTGEGHGIYWVMVMVWEQGGSGNTSSLYLDMQRFNYYLKSKQTQVV